METTVETNTDRLENIKWLKENSILLASVNPQETNSDLLPLKEVIGSAVLVGLGEATHGNKEFSQVKHRMLKFLVEEMDFDGLIMEVPEGVQAEAYVVATQVSLTPFVVSEILGPTAPDVIARSSEIAARAAEYGLKGARTGNNDKPAGS